MSKIYTMLDKMTFGRYKGKKVQEVFNKDPKYLLWCVKNVDWFHLTPGKTRVLVKRVDYLERAL